MFTLVRRDVQRSFELDFEESEDGQRSSRARNVSAAGRVRLFVAKCKLCFTTPGLHAVLIYRYGAWVRRNVRIPIISLPFRILYRALDVACMATWGVHIDVRASIGGGLYIGHVGGILIGPVTMGSDCNVGHHVTIGRRAGGSPHVPKIGNRVWIGTGSVVFGNITIGDGVTIGPLTVVARNLPPAMFVMGNPMRLVRRNYDNTLEIYGRRMTDVQPNVATPPVALSNVLDRNPLLPPANS